MIYQVSPLLLRSLLSYFRSFSPKRWMRQFAIQRVFSSPSRQGRGGELSYVIKVLFSLGKPLWDAFQTVGYKKLQLQEGSIPLPYAPQMTFCSNISCITQSWAYAGSKFCPINKFSAKVVLMIGYQNTAPDRAEYQEWFLTNHICHPNLPPYCVATTNNTIMQQIPPLHKDCCRGTLLHIRKPKNNCEPAISRLKHDIHVDARPALLSHRFELPRRSSLSVSGTKRTTRSNKSP